MRLIVLRDGAMIADVTCKHETVYLGSDQQACRLFVSDERLAARLLAFSRGQDGLWCAEFAGGDETHVLLNGAVLTCRTPLRAGDELRLLEYSIRAYPEFEEHAPRPDPSMTVAQLEKFVQSKLPPGAVLRKADEPLTLQPELLTKLPPMRLSLARCMTVQQLMTIVLEGLLDIFSAQRGWLGIRRVNYGPMEYVEGRLAAGQSCDLPTIGDALRPRVLDRSQFVLVPILGADERCSVLAGPIIGPDGPLGMMYLDTGDTGRRWTGQDLEHFVMLSHLAGTHLDSIFKELAANRAATLEGQVIVAHEIQARLTPRKLPQWERLQFGAFREPGRVHTGDIYDIVKLSNNQAAFLIAHTSATGALPCMLMAQAQAMFRNSAMHLDPPHIFVRLLNVLLFDGQRDHPLSAVMGVIDPETGQVKYAMAGATGAYIIDTRGGERRLVGPEPTPPAGSQKDFAYPLLSEQLDPHETLVLFTPGVTTAKNRKEEVFGEDRFVNILCDGFGQLASVTMKEMLADLRNFTESGSQPDDITVIMAHRSGEA